jgi:tetratricopeptide (TPR) repeat protein
VTRAVAAALSVEAQRRDPVGQLGRLLGARGRMLVVLDSVDRALDALPEAVGRWLKLAPEATFLITSRVAPNLLGERTTVLDALPPAAAVGLFKDRAGPLTGADAEALVGELCEALEGVPLAVELAAARARALPLDALVRDLSVQLLAAEGSDAPARHRSVAASLDWSFGMLSAAARDALCALSAFEGPFTPEAAAAVLGAGSPVDALGLLEELVEASLLRALPGGRRFTALRLVRMYARGVAAPELVRAAERRHGAWYAAGGQPAALAALVRTGGVERLRERMAEIDELVAACRRAVARGDGGQAVGALRAAWPVLERTGPLPLAVALADAVLGVADLSAADRAAAAWAAGSIYGDAGRADDALRVLTDALARATAAGDAAEASRLRSLLVRGALRSGQPDLAREHADRALAQARASGDRHAEASAQRLRGVTFRNLGGEFDAAQTAYAEALRLCRELGDRAGEGIVLGNLGLLLENFGFQDEALAAYNLALIIAREVEDARLEATILGNLGLLHAQRGDFEAAREVYGTAIALTRQTGDDRAYAIVLGNLANVDVDLGDFAAAQAGYEAALALHQQLGDARFESLILANLGNLFLATGEPAEARKWFLEARALARTAGARRGEALAEINLGKVAAELYEVAAARGHYEVSLALASETGDRRVEAAAWGELGALAVDEGDVAAAQAALATAEGVARGLNEPIRVAIVSCVWARLEATRGRLPEARARLAEAEAVAAQLKVGPASDLGREIRATQRALRAV